jgi:aspartokinase
MKVKLFHRPISLLTAFGDKVRVTPGVLSHFSAALYNNSVNLYAVSSGEDSVSFIIDYADEEKAFNVLRDSMKGTTTAFHELVIRSNKSMITVNATDMADTPGVAHASISGLAQENVNIIEMFSSYGSITIVIDPDHRKKAFDLMVASLKAKFKDRVEVSE